MYYERLSMVIVQFLRTSTLLTQMPDFTSYFCVLILQMCKYVSARLGICWNICSFKASAKFGILQ